MAMPKHIAVSIDDASEWCKKRNASINDCYAMYFKLLSRLLRQQVKLSIPILTVYLLPDAEKPSEHFMAFSDCMANFFNELIDSKLPSEHKIKVSIFGKWYKLPGKLVELLKRVVEDTKEYDSFFLNFCINYHGQEEIVDACKLIAKHVELNKIVPEMITKETIKENIYSSYFLPPDVILIYGERRLSGLLLWDSINSRIAFADKTFMEFEEDDISRCF